MPTESLRKNDFTMRKRIFLLLILLFSCFFSCSLAQEKRVSYYSFISYNDFLNYLASSNNAIRLDSGNSLDVRIDTLISGNDYIINRIQGAVKQLFIFKNVKNPNLMSLSSDSCFSALYLDSASIMEGKSLCYWHYYCPPLHHFIYNNIEYEFLIGLPNPETCTGSICRGKSYIVSVEHTIHVVEFADDITGLRYGDINNDGNLDLLLIENAFNKEDLEKLEKKGLVNQFNCLNGQCYKIYAITYINKKWSIVNDSKGKMYYFLIKLEKPFDPYSKFDILDYNWMN